MTEQEQITEMQQTIKELLEENDRLTVLNRHYLFKFFDGDVLKMQEDFSYLAES